jgi:nitrite reductase/ring-hydroxylating ferredoxin subunit
MGVVEIAGPEQFRFDALIRRGLEALEDPREVVADPHARYFGTELAERSLVPGEGARLGVTRFEDWLTHSANRPLKDNEFRVSDVPPGSVYLLAGVVAVYNVDGKLCATQNECTHARGPLCKGKLEGSRVTCPWHGSEFDVGTGAVLRGPAKTPLQTYRVTVKGDIGTVEP